MLKKITAVLAFMIVYCLSTICLEAGSIPEVIKSPKNSYTIIEKLGEGAFGKVYSAKDASGNIYAIKCYKDTSDSRKFYLDPKREYEIGRELNHPNIIRSHEYFSGTSKGKIVHYLVLQYVDGEQLYRFNKRCMNLKEATLAFDRLLSAFIHALEHERLYLDLHYGNLMLNQSFDIMIIDLASFFTFDEIHEFFSTKVVKKGPHIEEEKSVREMKIEQFFSNNPALFEKMQRVYQDNDLADIKAKGKVHDHLLLSYLTYYLDQMTEVCIQIILKSDLDRKSRMSLRAEIKRLAWNYEEDVDEQIEKPLIQYIQKLKQIPKSLPKKSL